MTAYYNEFDPQAAEWLRELIKQGHVAPGDVDTRSIEDVQPADLIGYKQCHFFAGIGGWSLALRLAGWPDDKPVWTGSCPCQPFSAAGKGAGFADERHLWPSWHHLIRVCKPGLIYGEQVAKALAWFDLVQSDLEAEGYACGGFDLPACGIGAPHIRQRLWFVAERLADASGPRAGRNAGSALGAQAGVSGPRGSDGRVRGDSPVAGGAIRALADAGSLRRDARKPGDGRAEEGARGEHRDFAAGRSKLVHAERAGLEGLAGHGDGSNQPGRLAAFEDGPVAAASAVGGFWSDAEWLACRDGKARPVEPGTFPLAHGLPARVVRLRGYGNAINPYLAAEVVKAYAEFSAARALCFTQ